MAADRGLELESIIAGIESGEAESQAAILDDLALHGVLAIRPQQPTDHLKSG
jgi:hypothetical protein